MNITNLIPIKHIVEIENGFITLDKYLSEKPKGSHKVKLKFSIVKF